MGAGPSPSSEGPKGRVEVEKGGRVGKVNVGGLRASGRKA